MSVMRQNIPNVDWHLLPVATVVRFFAVQPDVGIPDLEVLHRHESFGPNRGHGLARHVSDAYCVRVRRGGVVKAVDIADLVLGDVVILGQGDRVPAELRLVRARGLVMDESHVNGAAIAHKATHAHTAHTSIAHTAATVHAGHGEGVVTSFGSVSSTVPRSALIRLRAHRLRRRGLVVQNPRILQHRIRIRAIIVTADIPMSDIAQTVLEATKRGIYIHFVLPKTTYITPELEPFVHPQQQPADTLRHIRQVQAHYGSCAWMSDGTVMPLYRGVAGLTVATSKAADIHKLPADILAMTNITDAVRSILYNNTEA